MIVLVVGVIQGSVFYVQSMCHPPTERRITSLNLLHEVEYLDVIPGSDVTKLIEIECRKKNHYDMKKKRMKQCL